MCRAMDAFPPSQRWWRVSFDVWSPALGSRNWPWVCVHTGDVEPMAQHMGGDGCWEYTYWYRVWEELRVQ